MDTLDLQKIKYYLNTYSNNISQFIIVNTTLQKLLLTNSNSILATYPSSSSKYGIGNKENSFKTPLGIHRITEKIGDGAPEKRIFKDRKDTGINWHPGLEDNNLILTRILRLEGLEPGINKGPGIDSFDRYIYIHGTNKEKEIGTPMSHGCICMKNSDIIKLFDSVEEGTFVVITK